MAQKFKSSRQHWPSFSKKSFFSSKIRIFLKNEIFAQGLITKRNVLFSRYFNFQQWYFLCFGVWIIAKMSQFLQKCSFYVYFLAPKFKLFWFFPAENSQFWHQNPNWLFSKDFHELEFLDKKSIMDTLCISSALLNRH